MSDTSAALAALNASAPDISTPAPSNAGGVQVSDAPPPAPVPPQAPDIQTAQPQAVIPTDNSAPSAPPAGQQSPWKDLVKGALEGLAGGGGAKTFGAGLAGGAANVLRIKQQDVENAAAAQRQQSEIQFQSLQAAHLAAQNTVLAKQVNSWDEDHQNALFDRNTETATKLKADGLNPEYVTQNDTQSEMAALKDATAKNGGVAPYLSLQVGKNLFEHFNLNQAATTDAGLKTTNDHLQRLGQPPIDDATWSKLTPQQRITQIDDAARAWQPTNDKSKLADLKNDLALVQNLPDNGTYKKSDSIAALQRSIATSETLVQQNPSMKDQQAAATLAKTNSEANKNNAAANKSNFDVTQQKRDAASIQQPDVTGFTPNISKNEYNKRYDAFGKSKQMQTLQTLQGSYQQFQDTVDNINKTGSMNGAESVVGLFNAIGISATPLAGKGFRINQNTVAEHSEARGIDQSAYQKLLSLKNGDVITPQQLKDYSTIAAGVYYHSYVNAVDEAHRQGLPADFLPQGGGRTPDPVTIHIYTDAVRHTNPSLTGTALQNAAKKAASANGWSVN
jgi:hypothetical protein